MSRGEIIRFLKKEGYRLNIPGAKHERWIDASGHQVLVPRSGMDSFHMVKQFKILVRKKGRPVVGRPGRFTFGALA